MKPLQNPPFELTTEEKNSSVWQKMSDHIEERLALMRRQNDNSMTLEQTERLRGRISFAKELIGLDPTVKTTD